MDSSFEMYCVALAVIFVTIVVLRYYCLRGKDGKCTDETCFKSKGTDQPKSQVSDELRKVFKNFYDNHARESRESMTRTKQIHQNYMLEIESVFRRKGVCHHLEQTGNSTGAIKVRNRSECHKRDVMLVIDKHEYDLQVLEDDSRSGYAWLRVYRGAKPSTELKKVLKHWNFLAYLFSHHSYVDPRKTIDIIFDELWKVIHKSPTMKGRVKLRRCGFIVQLDVHPDSGYVFWGRRLYSVDLVPAYQVDGAIYVSKPLMGDTPRKMTWRRSYSVQEKQKLSENGYVLRALKVVRNREPELAPLTSNCLKAALFHEMDEECDWSDRALAMRFIGVLCRLETCLANGNLAQYFGPKKNLFSAMLSSCFKRMHCVIQRICTSEIELIEILKS